MNADDMRKYLDSLFDKLSPAKAQEIAKGLLGEDRREQAQKLAGDLMESAQRNRDRVKDLIAREVASQMKSMGVATASEVDALKRRVRDLERGGKTPSARKPAAKKPTAGTRAKTTARSTAAKRSSSASSTSA
ncbi:MAG: phasin family protein [Actinomycetota bacterium]|jgi:polyhydroxyalkanoate synthesis regulator phasin|nr:phasin family protein [Actinomycetota bacterium]